MDPLFVAIPGEAEIGAALLLWPELTGKQVRPLIVSAFGDIFVETDAGDVWVVSPIDLTCEPVAGSIAALEQLFSDPAWARSRLLTDVALLARDRGLERTPQQVFGMAPHPVFSGSIEASTLTPMSLRLWHHLASQIREP